MTEFTLQTEKYMILPLINRHNFDNVLFNAATSVTLGMEETSCNRIRQHLGRTD